MIRVENLNKTYDLHRRNANRVLRDVSFQLPQTGFVCILGPSGCGKTSLLNAIGGLDRFDSGTLSTDSVSVSGYGSKAYEAERNRSFGYIFQNYYLLPEHSVAYNVYLGMHSLELSHGEKLKRIRQALEAVDMSRYIRRKVGELSGGQQQRVAIARALARRPRVIFADEPTGNLDEANTINICTLLRKISRTSLVVMVTHEERIANFFADRIIKLEEGCIREDMDSWQREKIAMGAGKDLYAGDYEQQLLSGEGVSLRFLREEGAAPVELTVVALKDRVVIKLSDGRTVTCGQPQELPPLKEGKRPVMTLEEVDRQELEGELTQDPSPQGKAGRGLSFGMMLQEALHLNRGSAAKRVSMRLFLVVLTMLTVWTLSDYLTLTAIHPESFITTDSHILQVNLERGPNADGYYTVMWDVYAQYTQYLKDAGIGAVFIPQPTTPVSYKVSLLPQMESVEAYIKNFSYAPLSCLKAETLVSGRLPEGNGEIVVDSWVLEKLIASNGILSNAVSDPSFFLGEQLFFSRRDLYLTIVGISDSGEPSIYIADSDLLRLASVYDVPMPLSEFQAAHPGEYDGLTIPEGGCIVNAGAAGSSYADYVGHEYYCKTGTFVIDQVVWTNDEERVILNDADVKELMRKSCMNLFYLYCQDKQAVKELLAKPLEGDLEGMLLVEVTDKNTAAWNAYYAASSMKLDARTIVTATVMLLSMMMLYLLCRSRVQERIGMLAVYRLLGIPRRKLAEIFAMECLLVSLQTALPASAAAFVLIRALAPDMVLSWYAALGAYGCILVYHMLVALLPLRKLLKIPPAQLAAKYDY